MQPEALFELAVKFVFAQCDDARGLGALLGPYQRRALSGQRQDRERSGGQKMLFGAAVMIALMADGDDDAGLIIVPAMGGDPGTLAQSRARAVGSDQQTRLNDPAVRERHVDAVGARIKAATAVAREIDAFSLGARNQRIDQMPVFDHMRERLAGLDIAGKGQEHRPGGIVQLGIGDDHVEDRLRLGATWSQTPSASNSRRQAATIAVARGSRLGRVASAGSATMTGISAPSP